MRGGKGNQLAPGRTIGAHPSAPGLDILRIASCPRTKRSSSEPSSVVGRSPATAPSGMILVDVVGAAASTVSVPTRSAVEQTVEQSASSGDVDAAHQRSAAPAAVEVSLVRSESRHSVPLAAAVAHAPAHASGGGPDGRSTRMSGQASVLDGGSSSQSVIADDAQKLTFLYASPLMNLGLGGAVDLLDFKAERDTVLSAIRQSGKRVDVCCEVATTRNLRTALLDGCRVLHYSGHGLAHAAPEGGIQSVLAFEDGLGGTHALDVSALEQLVSAGARRDSTRSTLELVFVSACHSVEGGEAFVKAGVPHVIAVRREAKVQDRAACLFAEAFYYALLRARKTVREAFDVGVQAVANGTGIVAAGDESQKFLLLPESPVDGHDRRLFEFADDGPVVDVSRPLCPHNLPAFFPLQFLGRHSLWQQTVAGVRQRRAVVLVGPPGVGKTSLAVASAHYLLERHAFGAGVFMVSLNGVSSFAALLRVILLSLHETGILPRLPTLKSEPPPRDAEALAAQLAPVLRELQGEGGMCLLLDQCDGVGLPVLEVAAALQRLLARVESLTILGTSTEPLPLSGVAQRQLTIPPMAPVDCARLFVMLAPRSLTHAEIGSDRLDRLALEMERLVKALKPSLPEIDQFAMQTPQDAGGGHRSVRVVRWKFGDRRSAEIFADHVQQMAEVAVRDTPVAAPPGSALSFEVRGLNVIARLSHLRLLARHPVLRALAGSPRAISLSVHGLVTDEGKPRSLDDVGALLEMAGVLAPDSSAKSAHGSRGSSAASSRAASPRMAAQSERTQTMLEQIRATLQLAPLEDSIPAGTGKLPAMAGEDRIVAPTAPMFASPGGLATPSATSAAAVTGQGLRWASKRQSEELPASLEIDASEVELDEWLGGGTFGAVYAGTYCGMRVAVKQFFARQGSHRAFVREARMLSHLRHPNIVQLMKVCRKGGKGLLMISEFLPLSLYSYLHEPPTSAPDVPGTPLGPRQLLEQAEVLRLTRDIARGMHYLHTFKPAILHRNLKSQNLLLDDSGRVKVADFGWSRFKDANGGSGSSTFFHGWQWVAPEILSSRPYTEQSDVYSFAMISWEISARKLPYGGMNPIQIGLAVREQKLRPPIPPNCTEAHACLIQRCWDEDPEARPNFAEILALLAAMS